MEATKKIDTTKMLTQADEAEAAGFLEVSKQLRTKASRVARLALAYELYRVVKQEKVESFNAKLKEKTSRPLDYSNPEDTKYARSGYSSTVMDQLVMVRLETYPGLPPADVIAKVKEAKGHKVNGESLFDWMEVASVEPVATHVKLPDPIVFGRINGCTDRFFIADWGTDVRIGDLLQQHEG